MCRVITHTAEARVCSTEDQPRERVRFQPGQPRPRGCQETSQVGSRRRTTDDSQSAVECWVCIAGEAYTSIGLGNVLGGLKQPRKIVNPELFSEAT